MSAYQLLSHIPDSVPPALTALPAPAQVPAPAGHAQQHHRSRTTLRSPVPFPALPAATTEAVIAEAPTTATAHAEWQHRRRTSLPAPDPYPDQHEPTGFSAYDTFERDMRRLEQEEGYTGYVTTMAPICLDLAHGKAVAIGPHVMGDCLRFFVYFEARGREENDQQVLEDMMRMQDVYVSESESEGKGRE